MRSMGRALALTDPAKRVAGLFTVAVLSLLTAVVLAVAAPVHARPSMAHHRVSVRHGRHYGARIFPRSIARAV